MTSYLGFWLSGADNYDIGELLVISYIHSCINLEVLCIFRNLFKDLCLGGALCVISKSGRHKCFYLKCVSGSAFGLFICCYLK